MTDTYRATMRHLFFSAASFRGCGSENWASERGIYRFNGEKLRRRSIYKGHYKQKKGMREYSRLSNESTGAVVQRQTKFRVCSSSAFFGIEVHSEIFSARQIPVAGFFNAPFFVCWCSALRLE